LTCLKASSEEKSNISLYLPFDGSFQPKVVSSGIKTQKSGDEPIFKDGYKGKAFLIGGKKSAIVSYRGAVIDPRQGTIMLRVKAEDWNSDEDAGTTFFNFLPNSYLYKYHDWKDRVSFVVKDTDNGKNRFYNLKCEFRKGEWVFICVTWVDQVLQVYVNGERVGFFLMKTLMTKKEQGEAFRIGSPYTDKHTLIDEVYVLDYPLNETQIREVYTNDKLSETIKFQPFRVYTVFLPQGEKVGVWVDIRNLKAAKGKPKLNALITAIDSQNNKFQLGYIDEWKAGRGHKYFTLPPQASVGEVTIKATLLK
jgi:hypothetical protein